MQAYKHSSLLDCTHASLKACKLARMQLDRTHARVQALTHASMRACRSVAASRSMQACKQSRMQP